MDKVKEESWWKEKRNEGAVHTYYYTGDGYSNNHTTYALAFGTYLAGDFRNATNVNRIRFNNAHLQGNNTYSLSTFMSVRLHYNNAVATELAQQSK